jgi:hypothetical protein
MVGSLKKDGADAKLPLLLPSGISNEKPAL